MNERTLGFNDRAIVEMLVVNICKSIEPRNKAIEARQKSHTRLSKSILMSCFNFFLALSSRTSFRSIDNAVLIDSEEATPRTVYNALIMVVEGDTTDNDDMSSESIPATST